jgi:hypothetical protein
MKANRTNKGISCDIDGHHRGRDSVTAKQKRAGVASTMAPAHLQCIAKHLRTSAQHFADDRMVNALLEAHGTPGKSKLTDPNRDKSNASGKGSNK